MAPLYGFPRPHFAGFAYLLESVIHCNLTPVFRVLLFVAVSIPCLSTFWTVLTGPPLEPACQADTIPILVSPRATVHVVRRELARPRCSVNSALGSAICACSGVGVTTCSRLDRSPRYTTSLASAPGGCLRPSALARAARVSSRRPWTSWNRRRRWSCSRTCTGRTKQRSTCSSISAAAFSARARFLPPHTATTRSAQVPRGDRHW